MKRRTFIAKGIGAGLVAGASRPLLAADWQEETVSEPVAEASAAADNDLPFFWDG